MCYRSAAICYLSTPPRAAEGVLGAEEVSETFFPNRTA